MKRRVYQQDFIKNRANSISNANALETCCSSYEPSDGKQVSSLQRAVNNSAQVQQLKAIQNMVNSPSMGLQLKASQSLSNPSTSSRPVIQRYKDIKKNKQNKDNWAVGTDARVADSGETVTTGMRDELYATKEQIKWSNAILKSKKSGIALRQGSKTTKGPAPNGSGTKLLYKVKPIIWSSWKKGSDQDFWTDCGRAGREVMGPRGKDRHPAGNYKTAAGKLAATKRDDEPATFRDEILVKSGLGSTPEKARKAYLALSAKDKEAFDKKVGINKYANPAIGDAFVKRRDDKLSSSGFNFHWAGVIMTPGHDKVTLENYAGRGTTYGTRDDEWFFETYGPPTKKGQTFHERYEGEVGAKGTNSMTMTASNTSLFGILTNKSDFTLTATGSAKAGPDLEKGTIVKVYDKYSYWYKVKVIGPSQINKIGWIYSGFYKSIR